MPRSAATAFLGVGALAIALHFGLPGDTIVYDAFGFAAAAAIVAGVAINRPSHRWPWLAIALSQLLNGAGDVVYDHVTARSPGPADYLYLAGAGFLLVGVGALTGRGRTSRAGLVDAAIIALALGGALAASGVTVIVDHTSGLATVVSFAYPVVDGLLLVLLVRLLLGGSKGTRVYWLVTGSVLLLMVSDTSWVIGVADSTYAGGTSLLDAGWLGSYLLLGGAALHPSMRRFATSTPRDDSLTAIRIALIGAALFVAVLSRAIGDRLGVGSDATYVNGLRVVIVALVFVRLFFIVRELERLKAGAIAAERRFRLVFERAPIGISVGRGGIMSETNPALQRMLGYTGEELATMHFSEVTTPEDLNTDVQSELDAGTRDHFSVDRRSIRKDGTVIQTHVNVALDRGDGLGVGLIEDITHQRELEEQLNQAQKMEAIGKLAGGIAHDFNNLMTAALGYSDLMLANMGPLDPNRERVEGVRDVAVRAGLLTRQLLAFARRQTLNVSDIDLRDVVVRSTSLLRRLIGDDIVFETDTHPDPVIVCADASQLERVVVNLAVNAREAMPDGGKLRITVAPDGDDAVLRVVDTGVGIDDETRSRMFEPFFSTKTSDVGAGLGLSTVDGIVAQSGGTIDVSSSPGAGSVFTIRLPLVQEVAKVLID